MMTQATQLYMRARTVARSILDGDDGAGMVEYALLVALIAIVLIVAIGFFSGALNQEFSDIGSAVDAV